jgi:MFS family permease
MAEPLPVHANRPPPSRQPDRLLWVLIAGQLGLHSPMAGLRMAAPLQLLHEGRSAWAVGMVLALFAAAPVVSALYAGRMADRWGYHRPMFWSVALSVLGCVLAVASTLAASDALRMTLLCVGAMGTGAAANTGNLTLQRTAGLAARDSTERVRIFSWTGVAPSFANVIGPVAAGFMIDAYGFRAAFALLLLMPIVTLLVVRRVPHVQPPVLAEHHKDRTAWDLLQAPGIQRLLVVNWLLSMCWDVHTFAVPVLGHERGFTASTIGLILGCFTLSVTGVRLLLPLLAHRLREGTVLRAGMLGTAVLFGLYPLAPNAWLMGACAALLGVSLGCVQPMVLSMLHHLTPDHRHGEALALRSMALNVSSTLMPMIFGASGALVGAALLFWLVGGAVGAGSWLARRLATTARVA